MGFSCNQEAQASLFTTIEGLLLVSVPAPSASWGNHEKSEEDERTLLALPSQL
jgi:hypothetical protein